MSSPCHIELVLTEKNSDVKNETVRVLWLLALSSMMQLLTIYAVVCTFVSVRCKSAGMVDAVARAQVPGSTQKPMLACDVSGPKGAQAEQGAGSKEAAKRQQI